VRLDPDQLEWIVREVVRRLRGGSGLPLVSGEGPGEGAPPRDAHVVLTQTVITAELLKHKLQGVTRVSVPARAVVTPSVRDLLKERNIELVKGG
jgi:hypothetical protein